MQYTVFFHQNGDSQELTGEQAEVLEKVVKDGLSQSEDRLRMYISDKDVKDLFQNGAALEIYYEPVWEAVLGEFGVYQVQSVVLPLTGDLASESDAPRKTILAQIVNGGWVAWLCPIEKMTIIQ